MAVAFDSSSGDWVIGVTDHLAITHTASGTDRAALVAFGWYGSDATPPLTGPITYNGVEMDFLGADHRVSSNFALALYGIVNPPTGPQEVLATFDPDANWAILQCISATGVDQTTPFGAVTTAAEVEPDLDIDVVSAVDDLVFAAFRAGWGSATPNTGMTVPTDCYFETMFGGGVQLAGYKDGAASLTAIGATGDGTQVVVAVGVAFKAAAGGGGITGSGNINLEALTADGAGKRGHPGTGAIALEALTLAGAGVVGRRGTGAIALEALQVSGTGAAGVAGSGNINLEALTVDGAGKRGHPGTGAVLLEALQVSGAGKRGHPGTGAIAFEALQVSGVGVRGVRGSGNIALEALEVTGSGVTGSGTIGSGNINLETLQVSGAGTRGHPGSGAIQLEALQVTGVGTIGRNGTGAITFEALQVSGYDIPPVPTVAYKYIDGTAFDENGRMMTVFLGTSEPLPEPVKYLQGVAHSQYGQRYVTTWPGGANVRYMDGFAYRSGGVQIIAPDTPGPTAIEGLPVTRRGELSATTENPVKAVTGVGLNFKRVSMTDIGP